MANVKERLVVEQPKLLLRGDGLNKPQEDAVRVMISEMISSRFVDKREQLRGLGIYFKQTHNSGEYEMMQRMHNAAPKNVPQPLGIVVSHSVGGPVVYGYLLRYIEGDTVEYPLKEWISVLGKSVTDQIQEIFATFHAAGLAHCDPNRANALVRRSDERVFVIDPATSRLESWGLEYAMGYDRTVVGELIETLSKELRM